MYKDPRKEVDQDWSVIMAQEQHPLVETLKRMTKSTTAGFLLCSIKSTFEAKSTFVTQMSKISDVKKKLS